MRYFILLGLGSDVGLHPRLVWLVHLTLLLGTNWVILCCLVSPSRPGCFHSLAMIVIWYIHFYLWFFGVSLAWHWALLHTGSVLGMFVSMVIDYFLWSVYFTLFMHSLLSLLYDYWWRILLTFCMLTWLWILVFWLS